MINRDVFLKTRSDATVWATERRKHLTASMISGVVSARNEDVEKRLLERHVNPSSFVPYACSYGIKHEAGARALYKTYMKEKGYDVKVIKSGLLVNQAHPHLAATPDGIVITGDARCPVLLLECKTVADFSKGQPKNLREIIALRGNFYAKVDKETDQIVIRRSHQYYYQVICQLGVAGLKLAHLAIYLPRLQSLHVIEVEFDQAVWDKIASRSEKFYERHMSTDCPMDTSDFTPLTDVCSEPMDES